MDSIVTYLLLFLHALVASNEPAYQGLLTIFIWPTCLHAVPAQ